VLPHPGVVEGVKEGIDVASRVEWGHLDDPTDQRGVGGRWPQHRPPRGVLGPGVDDRGEDGGGAVVMV
jgi:hypothetical protein